MSRAFILVMDSLGIGASADADAFGDVAADTKQIMQRVFVFKARESSRGNSSDHFLRPPIGLLQFAFQE